MGRVEAVSGSVVCVVRSRGGGRAVRLLRRTSYRAWEALSPSRAPAARVRRAPVSDLLPRLDVRTPEHMLEVLIDYYDRKWNANADVLKTLRNWRGWPW